MNPAIDVSLNGVLNEALGGAADGPFSVLVAYENLVTRQRAMQLYRRLVEQLWDEFDFQCTWWKFDYLRDGEVARAAALAARRADMIIISVQDEHPLPPAILTGFRQWLSHDSRDRRALVALIERRAKCSPENSAVELWLRAMASEAGMDFLLHPEVWQTENMLSTAAAIQERARNISPVPQEILDHAAQAPAPSHWGLNE